MTTATILIFLYKWGGRGALGRCASRKSKLYIPGGNPGANLESISHRCYLREVGFEWELTKETICLLGCLQGGVIVQPLRCAAPLQGEPWLVDPNLGWRSLVGTPPRGEPWLVVPALLRYRDICYAGIPISIQGYTQV